MSAQALFGISVAVSFIAWAVVMRQYLWPALRSQSRTNALRPILLLHSFRFVGLAFLVPGVVSPDLPAAYARPAAYGDLATAILACWRSRRCAKHRPQRGPGYRLSVGPIHNGRRPAD